MPWAAITLFVEQAEQNRGCERSDQVGGRGQQGQGCGEHRAGREIAAAQPILVKAARLAEARMPAAPQTA